MIRNFFRHLLESIKSVKRNGWMTLASVSAVTITLTMAGIFLAVIMNATKLAQDVEGNVEVTVFVDIGTKDKELKEMRDSLAVGDTIVTIGGIVANVAKIEEETIVIEFGPSRTKMPIQKWAIGSVQSKKEIK